MNKNKNKNKIYEAIGRCVVSRDLLKYSHRFGILVSFDAYVKKDKAYEKAIDFLINRLWRLFKSQSVNHKE